MFFLLPHVRGVSELAGAPPKIYTTGSASVQSKLLSVVYYLGMNPGKIFFHITMGFRCVFHFCLSVSDVWTRRYSFSKLIGGGGAAGEKCSRYHQNPDGI